MLRDKQRDKDMQKYRERMDKISNDFLKEDIVDDAHTMHMDHEVQMAREELYHAAENAIALHRLLRHISEEQGLEGWISSKITLANDYLKTVRDHLEYDLMSMPDQPTPMPTEIKIGEGSEIKKNEKAVAEVSDISGLNEEIADVNSAVQYVIDRGGVIRYDDGNIDFITKNPMAQAIVSKKLVPVHYIDAKISKSSPRMGYSIPEYLESGVTPNGVRLVAREPRDDYISDKAFEKRYQSAKNVAETVKKPKSPKEFEALPKGDHEVCPSCHSADIKQYSQGDYQCNTCHASWEPKNQKFDYDAWQKSGKKYRPHSIDLPGGVEPA